MLICFKPHNLFKLYTLYLTEMKRININYEQYKKRLSGKSYFVVITDANIVNKTSAYIKKVLESGEKSYTFVQMTQVDGM